MKTRRPALQCISFSGDGRPGKGIDTCENVTAESSNAVKGEMPETSTARTAFIRRMRYSKNGPELRTSTLYFATNRNTGEVRGIFDWQCVEERSLRRKVNHRCAESGYHQGIWYGETRKNERPLQLCVKN